jgi:hypothetical protein
VGFLQTFGLGALAGARRPKKDQVHEGMKFIGG